jgi:hypothetical protein
VAPLLPGPVLSFVHSTTAAAFWFLFLRATVLLGCVRQLLHLVHLAVLAQGLGLLWLLPLV